MHFGAELLSANVAVFILLPASWSEGEELSPLITANYFRNSHKC